MCVCVVHTARLNQASSLSHWVIQMPAVEASLCHFVEVSVHSMNFRGTYETLWDVARNPNSIITLLLDNWIQLIKSQSWAWMMLYSWVTVAICCVWIWGRFWYLWGEVFEQQCLTFLQVYFWFLWWFAFKCTWLVEMNTMGGGWNCPIKKKNFIYLTTIVFF